MTRIVFDRATARLATAAMLLVSCAGGSDAITTQRVAAGLNRPIFVTAPAGDGRLFIVEQRGVIKVLEEDQVLATPFLDIDHLIPDISGQDERGLLGLAFHPDYAANGQFFVNYTNLSSDTVISRYLVSGDPNVADPNSAEILLTIDQPYSNHNGGTLLFGPFDGYLYIGMGDGGSGGDPGNRAQDDASLLGKMLRIDVDGGSPYAIPPDNPFAGPGLPLDEIWAKGLRNPYRWSFDRSTGDLYIADVGQSNWEEIDFEPAGDPGGGNYGWRLMEGNHCYNPPQDCNDGSLILPIHEYGHGGNPFRCSITGGYVYRGGAIPPLRGTYFFADWCSGQIWSFRYDGETLTEFQDRTAELAPGGGLTIADIASFGEDGYGELYIVDRDAGTNGEVYKIIQSPADAGELDRQGTFRLTEGRPNPFSGSTQLELHLDRPTFYEIAVLDASGRGIRTLESGRSGPGTVVVSWDGSDAAGRPAAAGIYFIRVSTGEGRSVRRLHLVR